MQENITQIPIREQVTHAIDTDIEDENEFIPNDQIYYYFKGNWYNVYQNVGLIMVVNLYSLLLMLNQNY